MMTDDDIKHVKSFNLKKLKKEFEYLGEGAARVVFAWDHDIVMKISKNKFGYYQNRIENYVYTYARNRLKEYLCPIIKFDPEILIVKRAIPINDDKEYLESLRIFCANIVFYQDILELCRDFYLSKDDIRATSSWGILNRNKVLIDYGCPSKQGHEFYKDLFGY